LAVVKRKKDVHSKKVEHSHVLKYEENYPDMLCAPYRTNSIPSVWVPRAQTWDSDEQALIFVSNFAATVGFKMLRSLVGSAHEPSATGFPLFLCLAIRVMLRLL
jgi:hypothetical protein